MKTYRTNALMAGVLYIVGTLSGILSVVSVGGFPDEAFLVRAASNPTRTTLAAFFLLVMGLSLAAMPVYLFPIFRKDSEPLALGMLIFRGPLEGIMYVMSALSWLGLGALGQKIAEAGADAKALEAVGKVALRVTEQSGNIQTIVFIVGAVCLYTSLYRTRLIPRWIAIWGLLGAVPYVTYAFLRFSGPDPGLGFLYVPLAVQEMVMALWFVIRGFDPDALSRLDA
jgi:hypothetical protein